MVKVKACFVRRQTDCGVSPFCTYINRGQLDVASIKTQLKLCSIISKRVGPFREDFNGLASSGTTWMLRPRNIARLLASFNPKRFSNFYRSGLRW